jgi:uncharacterized protein YheU (UPF0270 family)
VIQAGTHLEDEMHDEDEQEPAPRVEVPHGALAAEVLRCLIEEFVTRDGTDYGTVERTLGEKVAAVMQQLEAGELVIRVDPEHETIDIEPRDS